MNKLAMPESEKLPEDYRSRLEQEEAKRRTQAEESSERSREDV